MTTGVGVRHCGAALALALAGTICFAAAAARAQEVARCLQGAGRSRRARARARHTSATASPRKLPIKIVAIGSSSTSGAGASSPAATYPSRLEAELKARLPGLPITVLNKGIGGEEAAQMVARFDADVHRGGAGPRAVAGRQQLGAARSSDAGRGDPPGRRAAEGERHRGDPGQSAICAEDPGQARRRSGRRRHHGDRARRRGRPVRPLRGDAPLGRGREDDRSSSSCRPTACT